MGNEQQGGTSHHFVNDEDQLPKRNSMLWTKKGRVPASRQQMKSSWVLARDVSMDMLSRKTTKLNIKQEPRGNVFVQRPSMIGQRRMTLKKFPMQLPVPGKPPPIYRVPRMPTEKEVADVVVAYQLLCEFCAGPCIGDYVRCRICIKSYHCQCLYERGYVHDQLFSIPRLARQDWSCPDCRDLTRLLTEDEMNYLIYVFDQIDRNKDGYIILENYLEFCASGKLMDHFNIFSTNEDLQRKHFHLMDSKEQGLVTWSDFALFYSGKLLATKNRTFLTTKLTTKELIVAKNLFLKDPHIKIDDESNIIISKDYFDRVHYDLMLMIKKKYGGYFIDALLHENQAIDETIEKLSVVGWDEFVRQISILILLNRSNYDYRKPQIHQESTLLSHVSKTNLVSHINLTNTNSIPTKLPPPPPPVPFVTMSADLTIGQSFCKHGKILEKLNQRKHCSSVIDFSIVESFDEENNLELPKLKANAKDERRSISEPWSVVKDMEQLRTQPIPVTTTRYHILKI